MDNRQTILYGAGLSSLLGAIFIGFGTIASNAPQGQSAASPQAMSSQQASQLEKQQPSIAILTSRANGNSLRHLAASYGLRSAVELLLEAGAEKSNRNRNV